jgi:hypothetical protein
MSVNYFHMAIVVNNKEIEILALIATYILCISFMCFETDAFLLGGRSWLVLGNLGLRMVLTIDHNRVAFDRIFSQRTRTNPAPET